jgi:hypothetical protein
MRREMLEYDDVLTPLEVAERRKVAGNWSPGKPRQEYFSIRQIADRWQCSRGTVYNRLRAAGAQVLDFAVPGRKGKKVVSAKVLFQIESKRTRKLA